MSNEVVSLKTEIKGILENLLKYVESETFVGDESEVSRIEAFVNKKEVFINKINLLEDKIKLINADSRQKNPEFEKLDKQCKEIVQKIYDIEQINKRTFDKLTAEILSNVKKLKHQQKFKTGYYTGAASAGIVGDKFDIKQ